VTRRLMRWTSPVAGALALVMGLTFAAPPATTAAEAGKAPMARVPSRLSAATTAKLATLAPTPRAFAQTPSSPPSSGGESKSFFGTPAGVAAIVLMVAGVGFAVYSANHDRKPVKSPIR
jgi:hypothetical protein